MHRHRTEAPPPGSAAYAAQRALLLELVVEPPPDGDPIGELPARLRQPAAAVDAAIDALARIGLAERRGGTVRATPAALRFEELGLVRA